MTLFFSIFQVSPGVLISLGLSSADTSFFLALALSLYHYEPTLWVSRRLSEPIVCFRSFSCPCRAKYIFDAFCI